MKTTEIIQNECENNIDLLFFTSENIIFFHTWKYHFYSFRINIDFTACNKIKVCMYLFIYLSVIQIYQSKKDKVFDWKDKTINPFMPSVP